MSPKRKLLDFERPPVVEVVFGVQFAPVELLVPYYGFLWGVLGEEFTSCHEVPPLDPRFETFGHHDGVELRLSNLPPLPRVWFVDADARRVVQVQRERFHYNQKRLDLEEPYVDFVEAYPAFVQYFGRFREFLREAELGGVEPLQLELSYINLIPAGGGWQTLADVGHVLPDFSWRRKERFLATPEFLNTRIAFQLPERQGRLHVNIRSGTNTKTGKAVLQLRLTVRGLPEEVADDAVDQWFEVAREWIVRGFADLTSDQMRREVWGQREAGE